MVTENQFVSIKKLTGKSIIRFAARHNLREIQAELGADSHIDVARTSQNVVLAGPASADDITSQANALMNDVGIGKLRQDAVRALEIIVSLPAASSANRLQFFSDALEWIRKFFGVPILSAVIHCDEEAPHCHYLLLPLVNGRMNGSATMGNRSRLQTIHASFHQEVCRQYGLGKPKPKRKLTTAIRKKSASMVMTRLQEAPDLLDNPEIETALSRNIGLDPEPLLNLLGIAIPYPEKKLKSYVDIMTKPCSPEKPEYRSSRNITSKPIGFGSRPGFREENLSCVGFPINSEFFTADVNTLHQLTERKDLPSAIPEEDKKNGTTLG